MWCELYLWAWKLSVRRWPHERCYWHPSGLPAIAGVRRGQWLGEQVQVILEDGASTEWVGGCPFPVPPEVWALAAEKALR